MEALPLSRSLLQSTTKAVSVTQPGRKPDWNVSGSVIREENY